MGNSIEKNLNKEKESVDAADLIDISDNLENVENVNNIDIVGIIENVASEINVDNEENANNVDNIDSADTVNRNEKIIEQNSEQKLDETKGETKEETKEETKDEVNDVGEHIQDTSVEQIKEQEVESINKHSKYKTLLTGLIIALSTLLFYYLVISMFFINHFYIGTIINGTNVSCRSVKATEMMMTSDLNAYTLKLVEREGMSETISAGEVNLEYETDVFKKLKDNQQPFNWLYACFNTADSNYTVAVTYDERLLDERINGLSCFDFDKIVEPQNASFEYINYENRYAIIDEIQGNKVNKEKLKIHVADALLNREIELDLDLMDCYINPKYTSNSQKVKETRNTLDKYVSTQIKYTFGNNKEQIEGSEITNWLRVNENLEVIIEEEKVREYVNTLCERYNISGRTRNFKTTSGELIQIDGGDFAYSINESKEIENIILAIKEGKIKEMEPSYCDIGSTYVEINLSMQHIWFYKDYSLIVEGDIVTGNVRSGHTTPKGVYRLKYKAKNVVLRGPDYAAPVTFWMPFNGGIGMHDANWRSIFGGEIYKTDGSHGCINCPYHIVEVIYNNIEVETPVVCY